MDNTQKKRVQMQVSIAGHAEPTYDHGDFSLAPGDVVELHPTLADAWVEAGHARRSKAPVTVELCPAPIVAEPAQPEQSTEGSVDGEQPIETSVDGEQPAQEQA